MPPNPAAANLSPRQPLLYAALSFSAGIVLGARVWRPPTWWLVAIMVFVAAAAYFCRRRAPWAFALACGALALLGMFAIQVQKPALVNTEILRFAGGDQVTLIAHITRDGFRREGGFGSDRQVLEVESEQVAAGAAAESLIAKLRLTIYSRPPSSGAKPAPMPLYMYGQRCG
jgi:hypothetical protein